jgi:coenzyme F420-reducing hydrogenase delta subunit
MSYSAADVVVFACNWGGLSCVEAAAQNGLRYPASTRVVRVSCLSRINQGLILKAFELGADGVMLLGCEPGNCQFGIGDGLVEEECEKTRRLLKLIGLEEERLVLCQMPRGDGYGFVTRVERFIFELEQMQPATIAGA